ncbi:MAG TPA: CYTH domain-containing protein [Bacteroidales bacterium]|jgi:CYTH domain-containing protein|nr:CYTH domain-containing protein [Bacteroidales bacterium]
MATETERKFLVKGEFRHLVSGKKEIIQGYLSVDSERVIRIRIVDNKSYITIKSSSGPTGITRNEWQYDIPLNDALELMSICLPGRIEKTRFIVPSGKHTIEIDEFHGKHEGLVIAEIELEDENEAFIKPEWLGEEVTGRPEYYNSNMI